MNYSKDLMKPLNPNNMLALIVGSEPLPRTQIIRKVWAYIKEQGLQDTMDKRVINADAKLLTIFDGKKKVTMFEVTKPSSANSRATLSTSEFSKLVLPALPMAFTKSLSICLLYIFYIVLNWCYIVFPVVQFFS